MAEREKRRATTFVTSRGAIINVAAPSVYIAPGVTPVDVTSPAELREALGEELGLLPLLPSLKDLGMISPCGARYQGNPVLVSGGLVWDYNVYDPWVIYNPKLIRWEMWYTGQYAGREQIGRATSPDGITWTKDAGNPIMTYGGIGSWEETDVEEPIVYVVAPGEYKMLYQGRKIIGGVCTSQIGLAESTNGVTWNKYAGNPVLSAPDGHYCDMRSLWRDKHGVYNLIFQYWDENIANAAYKAVLRHATSLDLKVWVIDTEQITSGDLVRGTHRNRIDDFHIVSFGEILLLFSCAFIHGSLYGSNQSIDLSIGADWRKFTYIGTCLYPYERVNANADGWGYHEPCVVAGPMNDLRIYYCDLAYPGTHNINFAYLMLGRRRNYSVVVESTIAANTTTLLTRCTEIPCEGLGTLALTVECSYNAAAIAGIRVDVYGSPNGVDYDTDVLTSITPSFAAGTTVRKTEYINPNTKFLKARVVNLSLAQFVTNVKVTAVVG